MSGFSLWVPRVGGDSYWYSFPQGSREGGGGPHVGIVRRGVSGRLAGRGDQRVQAFLRSGVTAAVEPEKAHSLLQVLDLHLGRNVLLVGLSYRSDGYLHARCRVHR